jgi:hypothetical protein
LQNPSQINGDKLQNLKRETSRTFRNISSRRTRPLYLYPPEAGWLPILVATLRNKEREYLKGKINELETNNKNKNIRDLYRGINKFKKGYQPRINIIKDENGDLLADPQNILNRWKNFFNQVLNVHVVHDVK